MTSQMAAAIVPMAQERAVPVISPLAGANDLSGRQDAFFRVVSDAATSARQQGRALYQRGMRRLLPINDAGNAIFTRGWNTALAAQFVASGGSALPPLEYVSGPGVRFIDLAQRIAASGADGVSIAASAADSALLVQQLRRLRPAFPAGLSAWAGTEDLPRLGGTALDGVLVTQFFDRFSTSARWLQFRERYRQRFGDEPGYPALNGYDAMQLAASALASITHASVLAALRAVREFDGLQRRLTFDEYGDCLAPPYLTELRSGRYVAAPS
jgi:branched-chain amino acid transport system substrate-binding protein